MRLLTTILASLILAGCVSVPMASIERDAQTKTFSVKPDKANIYVYRNKPMGYLVRFNVELDGKLIGQTATMTYLALEVMPGKHTLVSKVERNIYSLYLPMDSQAYGYAYLLDIDVEAGNNYFIRQEVIPGAFPQNKLQLVDNATGKVGVSECRLIEAVKVTNAESPRGQLQQMPESGQNPISKNKVANTIERFQPKVLSASAFATQNPLRLIVRNATLVDLGREHYQKDREQETHDAALGAGSVGLGFAAGPMFGGAMVLGGAFAGLVNSAFLATESKQQNQIELALKQTDFVGMLGDRLGLALDTSPLENATTALEVVPLRYGVMETEVTPGIQELCVVSETEVTLRVSNQVLYYDKVLISPYLRSLGAPAPLCLTRERMSENDAKALREALNEYAATLPAMLKQRIPSLPWKP